MRLVQVERFYWLLKPSVRQAKLDKLDEILLEDDAYKIVPYGRQFFYTQGRKKAHRDL